MRNNSFLFVLSLLFIISYLNISIFYLGQQPRSTYLFLGNVALSDLVTGIAVIFGQYYPREYRDEYSCAIQIGKDKKHMFNVFMK